jgi:hypothetical protein
MGKAAMKRSVIIRIGDTVCLTESENERCIILGDERHFVNASNNRGRGAHRDSHIKGVRGEKAGLKLAGLSRYPLVLGRADANPDIPETTPQIEIKNGLPFVEEKKLRLECLYVILKEIAPNVFQVTHMATGYEIKAHNMRPNNMICPRCPEQNLMVPVIYADDERVIIVWGKEDDKAA